MTSSSTAAGSLSSGSACTTTLQFNASGTARVESGQYVLTDNDQNAAAPSYASQTLPLNASVGYSLSIAVSSVGITYGTGPTTLTGTLATVALTYYYMEAESASGKAAFGMQGGAIELSGRVFRGLSAVAAVAGHHAGPSQAGRAPLSEVVTTSRPRYTIPLKERNPVFADLHIGEANVFGTTLPGASGSTANSANGALTSASSLALLAGLGYDVRVSRSVRVRALESGWLRTQLPNGQSNVQNSLRLGAGVVLAF